MPCEGDHALMAVAASLDRFGAHVGRISEGVQKIDRRRKWQWLPIGLLAIAVALLTLSQFNDYREREKAQESRARIADCTTPEGKCAQEGAKRTGEVVRTINQTTIAVVVCREQGHGDDMEDLNACVADLLPASAPQTPSG